MHVRSSVANGARHAAVVVLCALAVGCLMFDSVLPPPTYTVQGMQPLPPVAYPRVLLLPPVGPDVEPSYLALLQESLRLSLTKEGYFVIAAPPGDAERPSEGVTEDPHVLADLAEKARADLVLVVRVLDFRPYPPPRVVLVVRAYVAGVPEVMWQLHGSWDLNESWVADRYARFRRDQLEHGLARLRHRAVIEAPREFLRYVAYEVAHSLATEAEPAAAEEPGADQPPAPTAP